MTNGKKNKRKSATKYSKTILHYKKPLFTHYKKLTIQKFNSKQKTKFYCKFELKILILTHYYYYYTYEMYFSTLFFS